MALSNHQHKTDSEPTTLTVSVLIGNSDDKLKQREWANFCWDVHDLLMRITDRVVFSGMSNPNRPCQNACWVCLILPEKLSELEGELSLQRNRYKQDSIALVIGQTKLI